MSEPTSARACNCAWQGSNVYVHSLPIPGIRFDCVHGRVVPSFHIKKTRCILSNIVWPRYSTCFDFHFKISSLRHAPLPRCIHVRSMEPTRQDQSHNLLVHHSDLVTSITTAGAVLCTMTLHTSSFNYLWYSATPPTQALLASARGYHLVIQHAYLH